MCKDNLELMDEMTVEEYNRCECDCEECDYECCDDVEEVEQELFTKEEVVQVIEDIIPKVMLNTESLNGIELNIDEFKRGIKETSYMCGQFIALTNVGMDKDMAYNVVLNESTSRANLKLAEVQQSQMAVTTMHNSI